MAYNLVDRFPPEPYPFHLLDPGSYQNNVCSKAKPNKAPFLSKAPRKTQFVSNIYTHAIYDAARPSKIPNCSTLMSKKPRFPYEALSKEDLEQLLCRCGINVCECPDPEEETDSVCQGRVPRYLYKGPPPRSGMGDGLSAPGRRDLGFHIGIDGNPKRLMKERPIDCPPFYDANVEESTAFYQGCKWSHWTSSRGDKHVEAKPGPADYTIETEPTSDQICAERVRAYKRKTSKQPRFIEMLQRNQILEGRPGPSSYSPEYPKGVQLNHLGPKAERFIDSSVISPGPADHDVKRLFDPPRCHVRCHAKLPEPAFFGIKAQRFKPAKESGASPASYNVNDKFCRIMKCSKAPFMSTTKRFKQDVIPEDDLDLDFDMPSTEDKPKVCPKPMSAFKSKTIRMKPLEKRYDEPSPADFNLRSYKPKRPLMLQYLAPFHSSEARLVPWYDWMPVFATVKTPGPCYYKLEKPRCYPAVPCGPLIRSRRFPEPTVQTPAPNEYNVGGGVETVLSTHNQRLLENIEKKHKFKWTWPEELYHTSPQEKEANLLAVSIQMLNEGMDEPPTPASAVEESRLTQTSKPKLLRSFLYSNSVRSCV